MIWSNKDELPFADKAIQNFFLIDDNIVKSLGVYCRPKVWSPREDRHFVD